MSDRNKQQSHGAHIIFGPSEIGVDGTVHSKNFAGSLQKGFNTLHRFADKFADWNY